MGGPLDFLMGGQNAMQGNSPVSVGAWATKNQGQPSQQDLISQLLAKEEERQKAEKAKALKLLGVGVMLGSAMGKGKGVDSGQLAVDSGKPAGSKSAGAVTMSSGGSRRDSGAAASKPAAQAAIDVTKSFAGDGAKAAGGFMGSPMGGAAVAGGIDLIGGLLGGGGDQEEIAKKQMKQQGQQNLGQGIRSMAEMLRSRNVEMRSVLANLGR